MTTIITFILGLVVGWNFLKQPEWAKKAVDLMVNKIKSYTSK